MSIVCLTLGKKNKNQNIDPMKTIKSHIHTIFFSQFFTIPIIHSSNHTFFQSYILSILHSFNPTLHSFNPIYTLSILSSFFQSYNQWRFLECSGSDGGSLKSEVRPRRGNLILICSIKQVAPTSSNSAILKPFVDNEC